MSMTVWASENSHDRAYSSKNDLVKKKETSTIMTGFKSVTSRIWSQEENLPLSCLTISLHALPIVSFIHHFLYCVLVQILLLCLLHLKIKEDTKIKKHFNSEKKASVVLCCIQKKKGYGWSAKSEKFSDVFPLTDFTFKAQLLYHRENGNS